MWFAYCPTWFVTEKWVELMHFHMLRTYRQSRGAALPPEPKLERASDGQGSKDSTRYLDGMEKEVAFCFPWLKTWGPRCSFIIFPCPSIRRHTNFTKAFLVHLAEMSIKIRPQSRRRHPTGYGQVTSLENTPDPGLSLRAAVRLQFHSGKTPTDAWVLKAVHRMPKVTPERPGVSQHSGQTLE